jgi:membrane-bound ClpP family serine protease
MSNAVILALVLMAVGMITLIAELLLPTFGVLGIVGVVCILGSIATCFWINQYLGIALLVILAIASPLLFSWAMRLWQRTPIGRKMILVHAESAPAKPRYSLGQIGIAMTAMRPIGECEFESKRMEAMSELGIISAGSKVKIVSLGDSMPVVRKVEA